MIDPLTTALYLGTGVLILLAGLFTLLDRRVNTLVLAVAERAFKVARTFLAIPGTEVDVVNKANETALMFGSDLPSTRANRPFYPSDVDMIARSLDPARAERALLHNAIACYRPAQVPV